MSWSVASTGAAYKGDSGGPLIVGGVQVGVTSTAEGSAKPDNFNSYASVATHRDWIRTIAGI
jgi:secreted trypsin-like serine protease